MRCISEYVYRLTVLTGGRCMICVENEEVMQIYKDPYNILVENNRVYKLGGWEFLDIANKLFDNEKQLTIRFIRRRALASGDKLVTKGTYAKMARGE